MVLANRNPFPDVTDNDKLMGLLAYIVGLIVPIIILLSPTSRARPFQRYHAIQALGFQIAISVIFIGLSIIIACVTAITGGVGIVLNCFLLLLALGAMVLAIYYAVAAYSGDTFDVPVLTDFMRGQNWL